MRHQELVPNPRIKSPLWLPGGSGALILKPCEFAVKGAPSRRVCDGASATLERRPRQGFRGGLLEDGQVRAPPDRQLGAANEIALRDVDMSLETQLTARQSMQNSHLMTTIWSNIHSCP
jgi:hypothetical protein